jgi:hypothetical protein
VAYLIDCDAIAHCEGRQDCDQILNGIVAAVRAGTVKTVEQVYDELRRWPDIQSKFTSIKKEFIIPNQYRSEIASLVGTISDDFPFLYDLTGIKNPDPADPWLIAAGKVMGWTVVTDERPTSIKKIPYVCRQQSLQVRCINGPALFQEIGII